MNQTYKSIITTVAAGLLAVSVNSASAASIAFTGFNADGLDNLSFVTLESIAPSTTIYFSDQEWNGLGIGSGGAFNTGESGFQWTSPAFALGAGTVISINDINQLNIDPTSNFGTTTFHDGANKGISNGDESVYAYFGGAYAPTSFLAIIGNDLEANVGSSAGTGTGVNKLYIPGDEDIMAYVGPRSGLTSFASYLPYLTDSANWITQDGSGDQSIDGTAPNVPFDTTPFTVPEPAALSLGTLGLLGLIFRQRLVARR
jgi:hypothetical protein